MDIQEKAQKIAAGTVALATTGLSGCDIGGSVDPPPPPFSCEAVDEGETLEASGQVDGSELTVTVEHVGLPGTWESADITSVEGASVTELEIVAQLVRLVLELDTPTTTAGSFTLEGVIESCPVSRAFDFAISDGTVQVAIRPVRPLPLAAHERAEIAVLARNGRLVELDGRTAYEGAYHFDWAVTGGKILAVRDGQLVWELPEEPGLYQVELVVDYGEQGFAADALAFEVG